jgi:hypothetical protein
MSPLDRLESNKEKRYGRIYWWTTPPCGVNADKNVSEQKTLTGGTADY